MSKIRRVGTSFGLGTSALFLILAFQNCSQGFGTDNSSAAATTNPPSSTQTLTEGISLFAGQLGGSGNANGVGQNASFYMPAGIASDSSGNLYVADAQLEGIRKITPDGVVSLFAGAAGPLNPAFVVAFSDVEGIAVDANDNVYVSDYEAIRKITPDGVVTTLAGSGTIGSANGTGGAASFHTPRGLAVDGSGNVYVADSGNHLIRQITSGGVVTTLAGTAGSSGSTNATGTSASFNSPSAVAVDGSGSVYVADSGNHLIRQITSGGVVTTLAGTAGSSGTTDATGTSAKFNNPKGITIDGSGDLYVADEFNNEIRKITSSGVVTTLAGTTPAGAVDGAGSTARFRDPCSLTVTNNGNIYVADTYNVTIREVTPAGVVTTFAGRAANAGTTDGVGTVAKFNGPAGLAIDSEGTTYISDTANHTVRKITATGVVSTLAGTAASPGTTDATGTAAKFHYPYGIAVDSSGDAYVADSSNSTIRKITASGVVTTFAGTVGVTGSADGTGTAASFQFPKGIAIDGNGDLYVADTTNNTIRKITASGVVTTFAGTAGASGSTDGTGSAARFNGPSGIAIGDDGTIFVTSGNTIRKITTGAVVTTLAGTAGVTGSADGTGAAASFKGPAGLAVDASGNVYVADSSNNTIRKITPDGVVTTVAGVAGVQGYTVGELPGVLDEPTSLIVVGTLLTVTTGNVVLRIQL